MEKIFRVLWRHGMERMVQQERPFIGEDPEAELIAWVRISSGEMGRSSALGSSHCVSKSLSGRKQLQGWCCPCRVPWRGHELKKAVLGNEVGARSQGDLMAGPMDFILYMKEVFSGFYKGEQQSPSYLWLWLIWRMTLLGPSFEAGSAGRTIMAVCYIKSTWMVGWGSRVESEWFLEEKLVIT